MLTRVRIRNFKRFDDVEIELGDAVVLVGPNNSGKTTALQALALWQLARDRWLEVRGEGEAPKKRPGVTINRRDLVATPVPQASLLWKGRRFASTRRTHGSGKTEPIHVEIHVEGVGPHGPWSCGFEIDYDNEESIRSRIAGAKDGATVPDHAKDVRVAFLPPMAGLVSAETRIDRGAIDVRIGEGRTAEVLRNLCLLVADDTADPAAWSRLQSRMTRLFGIDVERPEYVAARGEITMGYVDSDGVRLDLSSAGRGMQQTLLLLAYMEASKGGVFLLDEPDAHLEILRQREIYDEITGAARDSGSQIVAATHSEVILNEAADRDVVVAFVGKPHRIDDRGKRQVRKALISIGAQHYYKAERTGWILYLEGSTDLAILTQLATVAGHPALDLLRGAFVEYVMNQPAKALEHFFGLQHAKPDLVGVAIFDRIDVAIGDRGSLRQTMWSRREIENYVCQPETLIAFAAADGARRAGGPLFERAARERSEAAMRDAISRRVPPAALQDRSDAYWARTKASDDLLAPAFSDYYRALDLPNLMNKSDYHTLAPFVARAAIDPEVVQKLDLIVAVAAEARPTTAE